MIYYDNSQLLIQHHTSNSLCLNLPRQSPWMSFLSQYHLSSLFYEMELQLLITAVNNSCNNHTKPQVSIISFFLGAKVPTSIYCVIDPYRGIFIQEQLAISECK